MEVLTLELIREALKGPFPGEMAHQQMMSYKRALASEAIHFDPPPKISAVMMVLFYNQGQLHTLFMKRPDNQGVHSGQISFPGGKQEKSDISLQETALRETNEEIGLSKDRIDVIGRLSEIYIPPSHFIVHPFIGFVNEMPLLTPNPEEVDTIISFPLSKLFDESIISKKEIFIPKYQTHVEVPVFDLYGYSLWGATAMMIAEFKMMVENFITK